MGGIDLLAEAQSAGLVVRADGDRLVIEGPKGAAAVAQKLIQHKAEVMAVLAATTKATTPQKPRRPSKPKAKPLPKSSPQSKLAGVMSSKLQWPKRPCKTQHPILGPRLRWTEKSKRCQIEKFPEDGDPIYILLIPDGFGWRVFDHRRTLKAAKSHCQRHCKQNERQNRGRAA